ncbi:hemagglutinin repeat-containing protein [Phascolarctobacterium succinatutens]|uniref:hemagglutinin repeat-containing protein n=1 Tax=Phascolarctobacterium succinatutens TaxID=626940 RepID=UPI003FD70BA9
MFAGGGLGFTIGKEKQKDQYANQNVEQVGSTVGSVKGSVKLDADKVANVKGSSVVAGKDINITGENVSIENSNSVYNTQEKHEFKRTGLSVSVGGGYVDVVNNAANSVKHVTDVEDKRLGALVAVKGYKDTDKAIKDIKGKGGGKINENLSVNISLGTTKSKSESNSTTTVANASEVKAGGEVNVTSTKKDIDITGSNVEGKDVTLNAKENLSIIASKNTNKTEQSSKSSSASVGASLELGKGPSYSISGSMSKGEVSANGTTFNESNVTANKDLSFTSGKDTNIKGGNLSGEKGTGSVGGDLNIESKQDSNNYKESNKSVGVSVGLGSNKAVSGSASVGKIDSNYKSVTDQSGIYAGKEGFEINVGENTDLKGGIISSEAEKDKNKISTGTLTYEDIKNKADYKAGSIGINVDTSKNAKKKDAGVTPNIGVGAKDNAESVTKATVSVLQNREWYEKKKDKLQLTGKVGDLNEYEIFKEVVGVDESGNDVELRADTKDWMIGYSRDLVEAVANIKPGDRIKFSDGSIYYVQPNGELYKEDSIGALMPYKEISLEDHNVTSKRESLLGKDTVISDDHHEKAGQYVMIRSGMY